MKKSITVAGVTAGPGQKAYGAVAIPDLLADGQILEIPFIVFNGSKDGPWLYMQVAQHASEVHALEGIRRVLANLDPKTLSGAITFCLPNPLGFSFPACWEVMTPQMNRVGLGDPNGILTERIVDAWWVNFVKGKADYVIDFHTGRRGNPVWVFYEGRGVRAEVSAEVVDKAERMARVFGAELLYKEMEPYLGGNTFRGACVKNGIPTIVPELDGHSIFVESVVQIAARGLKNIMVDLGMIKGKIELPPKQYLLKWVADERVPAVRNNKGGVFIPLVKMGDIVKKGDKVGIIYSPRTLQEIETLTAHKNGYVFSIAENPVKNAGDSVMEIEEILEVFENR